MSNLFGIDITKKADSTIEVKTVPTVDVKNQYDQNKSYSTTRSNKISNAYSRLSFDDDYLKNVPKKQIDTDIISKSDVYGKDAGKDVM